MVNEILHGKLLIEQYELHKKKGWIHESLKGKQFLLH
jgi:hypothetical protein